jgi:hypothetical protein
MPIRAKKSAPRIRAIVLSAFRFMGEEGLGKLDPHGENHGMLGRAVRASESLTDEERPNLGCETALKERCLSACVSTDGSDKQRAAVNQILKDNNARNLRYFGCWTLEHS